jgi:hypothetical protein
MENAEAALQHKGIRRETPPSTGLGGVVFGFS